MTVTIPWWVLGSIIAVSVIAATYMLGRVHGYDSGVRDTEQRWSDAVRRKGDYDAGQLGMEQPWWKERA